MVSLDDEDTGGVLVCVAEEDISERQTQCMKPM